MQRNRKKSRWKTKKTMGRLLLRRNKLPVTHITDNELDYNYNDDEETATKYYY
jgi:hypothetical protein